MNKLRVILVGLGFWGKEWIAELKRRREEISIAGIVSIDSNELRLIGEENNIPAFKRFSSIHEAIQREDADAVIVVVPPDAHYEVIQAAIDAGLHILTEKPLAATYDEALAIGRLLAERPELVFMVDQTRRWRSHIQTVKDFIAEGHLGKIGQIILMHLQAVRMGGYRAEFPNIVIDDMAIHHFDIIRVLTGAEPFEVHSYSHNPSWSWFDNNATSCAHILMSEGIDVLYFGSWVSRGKLTSWEGNILLIGEKGTLEIIGEKKIFFYPVESGEEERMLWEGKVKRQIEIKPMTEEEIGYGLTHFLQCIQKGKEPETNYEDNMRSFAMVCMAQKSLELGRAVTLADLED
jgi:predicted dehydrogenase